MTKPAHYSVPDIPDSKLYRGFEAIVGGYWTKAAYRSWRRRRPLGRIDRDLRVRVSRIDEEGLDVAVAGAVLRVHREDDEMAEAVHAVLLRLEGVERVEEVGHPEALVGPAGEVAS